MLYIVCFDPAQLTPGGRSAISCSNAIEVRGSHAQRRSANPTKGGGKENYMHGTLYNQDPPHTVVTRAKSSGRMKAKHPNRSRFLATHDL